jgi:prepilin-type N-terminal cleavage/methylation domain-containing protein
MMIYNKEIKTTGFTIMEVMVAVVIFSIVLIGILRLMSMGDKISGRKLWMSQAVILAENQAEKIGQQESSPIIMGDTSYQSSINGQDYQVDRVRVNQPANKFADTASCLEFMITVKRLIDPTAQVNFRVLQGTNGDKIITKK